MPAQPTPSGKPGKSLDTPAAKRIVPANLKAAGITVVAFTALLYLIELVDTMLGGDLDQAGIQSRTLSGLDGVIWAPLLHYGWSHLFSNTIPVLVFAFLAMAGGIGQWAAVTATIWVVGGLGVWLIGPPNTTTVGASVLAFGWLAYLLVRGIFNRSVAQLAVAIVLLFFWGSTLWGLLPGDPAISWQGHLFGAIGGVLAAWIAARADKSGTAKAAPTTPGNLGL